MDDLIFDVTIDEDGRFVAVARGSGIATDGATWEEMRANVRDLIAAYYEGSEMPREYQLLQREVSAAA
jgi:predicted RNase H-like HicB family nuclease